MLSEDQRSAIEEIMDRLQGAREGDPTPEEIAAATELIRSTWSDREFNRRSGYPYRAVFPQVCPTEIY